MVDLALRATKVGGGESCVCQVADRRPVIRHRARCRARLLADGTWQIGGGGEHGLDLERRQTAVA